MKPIAILCLLLTSFISSSQVFYMDTVISYTQGMTNNGNSITQERSNPLKCLGSPQKSDVEVGNLNFFSLGFGGSITLKVFHPVVITPLTQLEIFETTYNYQCSNYPEKAKIFVSKDNYNFQLVGETCGNNNTIFSLYQKIDTVNYVKIQDYSDQSKFSNFINADAYDLDGIQIFELIPLSIELDFFNVKVQDEKLFINFRTLSESGTLRFHVQTSIDAINFKDLEIYFMGANYSSFPRDYSGSIDYEQKEKVEYVRLKEVDNNGDVFYFTPVPIVKKYKIVKGTFYDILGRQTSEGNFLIKY